uniref:Uncharacterized protein n=1 Tax=Molossus molossus TaxID=27622 RepID=A0A7J8FZI2_MOLMO|nr:hypothetical protein HJG59_008156 [Molossus molossus]
MEYGADSIRGMEKRATPHFVNCSNCANGPSPSAWDSALGLACMSCGSAHREADAPTSAVGLGKSPSEAQLAGGERGLQWVGHICSVAGLELKPSPPTAVLRSQPWLWRTVNRVWKQVEGLRWPGTRLSVSQGKRSKRKEKVMPMEEREGVGKGTEEASTGRRDGRSCSLAAWGENP